MMIILGVTPFIAIAVPMASSTALTRTPMQMKKSNSTEDT